MQQMRQVALITGASRGIGRGIALHLARLGWDLALHYGRNRSAAEQTAALCQEEAQRHGHSIQTALFQAQMQSPEERHRLIEALRNRFDRLHLLVNNAGAAPARRVDMLETQEQDFLQNLQINLIGPFFLTQAIIKWMLEQAQSEGPDRPTRYLITISSISAYTASVNRPEYCIAKAGLSMLTKLFAVRLADHGIGVFEIRPGIIQTDMTAPVREKYDRLIAEGLTPIRRWGTPDDVGKAVAAIVQGYFPFSTGEVLNVDGGFHLRAL